MEHTILDRILARLNHNSDWLYALAEKLWDSPELGFSSSDSGYSRSELEALAFRTGLARTGVAAELGAKDDPRSCSWPIWMPFPARPLPAEMSRRGHHAQMAVMLGPPGRWPRQAAEALGLRIVFAASPAEEYVDLGRRLELRRDKEIVYLSGKQEMIRLGFFDTPQLVIKYHSMGDAPDRVATVNGGMNGFMAKRAEFIGRLPTRGRIRKKESTP